MRQRLAIERALLHNPRLVLLDEPFTGLDDASTEALQQRLGRLRGEGAIVLLTTHDLEAIETIIDRAVMLSVDDLPRSRMAAVSSATASRHASAT